MLIAETIAVALSALRANKLRSFLTMLGIVIGVGAVIAMVAIGKGAQQQIQDRITALGTTMLTITAGQQRTGGVASLTDRAPLNLSDAVALKNETKYVLEVQPQMQTSRPVVFQSHNANLTIVGTTANFPVVRKTEVDLGRFFTDAEDRSARRVAVVGSDVATQLGLPGSEVLLDQMIRIGGIQFQVVGVLEEKGASGTGMTDDQVFIPAQTARYRVNGTPQLASITALAESEEKMPDAMAEIDRILRREHKLTPGKASNFTIRNQADILTTAAESSQTFTALLAGIAGVSLLVGGIGIMNIMLVSVTERTREIGVRKALGATRWNILLQFLIEAVVLCTLGGAIGVAAGGGGAIGAAKSLGFTPSVSPEAVMGAFAFSAAVGILFGVWPARRAALLDPIVALRYE